MIKKIIIEIKKNVKLFEIFKKFMRSTKAFYIFVFFILFFSGCEFHMPKKVKHSSIEFLNDINQESMMKQANFFLKNGNSEAAKEILESIRAVHPFTKGSEWAMLNLLKIYKAEKRYIEIISVSDQFLDQTTADHPKTEYVSFLYADAHFYKMGKKARNIEDIKDAIEILSWFLEEFGEDSKFGKEIKKKLDVANGRLIFREIEIGNFYEKKSNFVAALKRYLNAYKISENNIYTSEILYRIYYCYLNLGLDEEAAIFYKKIIDRKGVDQFSKLAKILNQTFQKK
jgi:outer membrane assembly lipoprotein YfiO